MAPCMLTVLKPVILVNQFIGVCPHDMQDGTLVFSCKSPRFFKTLFTLIILTIYFLFTCFQFGKSVHNDRSMVEHTVLAIWIISTLIPIAILCVTFCKRHQFTHFFLELIRMKQHLKGIENCFQVAYHAWKFYAFFMFLALLSSVLTFYEAWLFPMAAPHFLSYYDASSGPPPKNWVIMNCIFQTYIKFISHCACAMIEVLCAALSGSTVNKIMKIKMEMKLATDICLTAEVQTHDKKYGYSETGRKSVDELNKILVDNNANVDSGANGLPNYNNLITKDLGLYTECGRKPNVGALDMSAYNVEPGKQESGNSATPILVAIQKFNFIAKKQHLINCIFGSLLALNIAWLVFNVCLLWFIQIRCFSARSGVFNNANSAATAFPLTTNETDLTSEQDFFRNAGVENHGLITVSSCISISVVIYTLRLIILLVSLGNVQEESKHFDSEINNTLMKIKQQPVGMEMHLILVHLMGNQINPVSFSAGGFFVFSRGTILYVFSIVTTYVVFLLQA